VSVGRPNDDGPYVAGILAGVLARVLWYVLTHFPTATTDEQPYGLL
jgi:hypothetical protein